MGPMVLSARCGRARRARDRGALTREYIVALGAVGALVAGAFTVVHGTAPEVACAVSAAVRSAAAGECAPEPAPRPAGTGRAAVSGNGADQAGEGVPQQPTTPLLTIDDTTTLAAAPSLVSTAPTCDPAQQWIRVCARNARLALTAGAAQLTAALDAAGVCLDARSFDSMGRVQLLLTGGGPGSRAADVRAYLVSRAGLPDESMYDLEGLSEDDDPILLAAVGSYLERTLGEYVRATSTAPSPGQTRVDEQVAAALVTPIAAVRAGLGRAAVTPECGYAMRLQSVLANGRHPGSSAAAYLDVCVVDPATQPGGACPAGMLASIDAERPAEIDESTRVEVPGGPDLAMSVQARATATLRGVVPGNPDASYDEVVAYCAANAVACRTAAEAQRREQLAATYQLFQAAGVCVTDAECERFLRSVATTTAPSGSAKTRAAVVTGLSMALQQTRAVQWAMGAAVGDGSSALRYLAGLTIGASALVLEGAVTLWSASDLATALFARQASPLSPRVVAGLTASALSAIALIRGADTAMTVQRTLLEFLARATGLANEF